MNSIYKQKWSGSSLPEVKSGTATFECNGELLELHLNDFKDFLSIENFLDAVIEKTHYDTKSNLKSKIIKHLE